MTIFDWKRRRPFSWQEYGPAVLHYERGISAAGISRFPYPRTMLSQGGDALRIAVTGGGSSGHVSPALAVIGAITKGGMQPREGAMFRYFGGRRGLEREIVESAGIEFVGVTTGKLRRYFSFENLLDMLRVPVGIVEAAVRLGRFRPDVLFSTGGYVAVPAVVAAWILRIPVIIHEQTVQIGLANRIIARFATRIALSFAAAQTELRAGWRAKSFVAGNPVRPLVLRGDAARAVEWSGFSPAKGYLPTLYITGGSQGARIINRAVEEILPSLLERCRVIHQCGRQPDGEEQDYDRLRHAAGHLPEELRSRYHVVPFIRDEIGDVYALADLVVGRAGANTVVENCALGKPALYIPLVPTGGDEQTRNARMCEEIGAARLLRQRDLNGSSLFAAILELLGEPEQLRRMGAAARSLARPDAATTLADAVVRLAAGRP